MYTNRNLRIKELERKPSGLKSDKKSVRVIHELSPKKSTHYVKLLLNRTGKGMDDGVQKYNLLLGYAICRKDRLLCEKCWEIRED